MKLGFNSYNVIPIKVIPTTREILDLLTDLQKLMILDGFVRKIKIDILYRRLDVEWHSKFVVKYFYKKHNAIEEESRACMCGEIVIEPAVYDPETGEEISPAVYNTLPKSVTELKDFIKDDFSEDFAASQIADVLDKMVKFSKYAGDGDWKYYEKEIKKKKKIK